MGCVPGKRCVEFSAATRWGALSAARRTRFAVVVTLGALLVAAPLVYTHRNGWVLLLDWAPGPRSSEVNWVQLPSGPLLKAVVALAAALSPSSVGGVLPAVAVASCFVSGAWLALRWKVSALCAFAGGAAASLSPFVINRLYVGQVGVLFGTAALLLFGAAALDAAETGRVVPAAVWAVVAPAFSLHLLAPVLTVAAFGAVVVARRNSNRAGVFWFARCAAVTVVSTAVWVVPVALLQSGDLASPGTPEGVGTFVVDGSWWSLLWSLPLGAAFWRPTSALLGVPAVVVACVAAVTLAVRWFHGSGWTRDVRSVAFGSLVVGASAASLGRGVFGQWWNLAASAVPLLGLYREPGKMLVLTVPAVVVGAAALIPTRRWAGVIVAAALCGTSAFTLSRLAVVAPAVSYPSDWDRVASVADDGCRIAVIGDEAYMMPFFVGGRVVANPASGFFGSRAAVSDDPEVKGLYPRNGSDGAVLWVWTFHREIGEPGRRSYGNPAEAGIGWAMVDRPARHDVEVNELEQAGFVLVFSTDQVGLWRTVEPCLR